MIVTCPQSHDLLSNWIIPLSVDGPMGFFIVFAVIGYLFLVNQSATAGFDKLSLPNLTN